MIKHTAHLLSFCTVERFLVLGCLSVWSALAGPADRAREDLGVADDLLRQIRTGAMAVAELKDRLEDIQDRLDRVAGELTAMGDDEVIHLGGIGQKIRAISGKLGEVTRLREQLEAVCEAQEEYDDKLAVFRNPQGELKVLPERYLEWVSTGDGVRLATDKEAAVNQKGLEEVQRKTLLRMRLAKQENVEWFADREKFLRMTYEMAEDAEFAILAAETTASGAKLLISAGAGALKGGAWGAIKEGGKQAIEEAARSYAKRMQPGVSQEALRGMVEVYSAVSTAKDLVKPKPSSEALRRLRALVGLEDSGGETAVVDRAKALVNLGIDTMVVKLVGDDADQLRKDAVSLRNQMSDQNQRRLGLFTNEMAFQRAIVEASQGPLAKVRAYRSLLKGGDSRAATASGGDQEELLRRIGE